MRKVTYKDKEDGEDEGVDLSLSSHLNEETAHQSSHQNQSHLQTDHWFALNQTHWLTPMTYKLVTRELTWYELGPNEDKTQKRKRTHPQTTSHLWVSLQKRKQSLNNFTRIVTKDGRARTNLIEERTAKEKSENDQRSIIRLLCKAASVSTLTLF